MAKSTNTATKKGSGKIPASNRKSKKTEAATKPVETEETEPGVAPQDPTAGEANAKQADDAEIETGPMPGEIKDEDADDEDSEDDTEIDGSIDEDEDEDDDDEAETDED